MPLLKPLPKPAKKVEYKASKRAGKVLSRPVTRLGEKATKRGITVTDLPQTTSRRRILARANYPEDEAPELDWINSAVRLLGKSFGRACRDIEADIAAGYMIVVRIE
jgi:hypothetical protein